MTQLLAVVLGGFLCLVGVAHFVLTGYFETLVPAWLPRRRALVLASGVVEVAVGAGLLFEDTRQIAGAAASALMALYVLTHVDALLRASPGGLRWLDRPLGAIARVVVNLGYLAWALVVAIAA